MIEVNGCGKILKILHSLQQLHHQEEEEVLLRLVLPVISTCSVCQKLIARLWQRSLDQYCRAF